MPLLTTTKLIAVFDQFASEARTKGVLGMLDAVQANETGAVKYNQSAQTPGYKAVRQAMFDDSEQAAKGHTNKEGSFSREVDALRAGALTLQQNQQYYLIKGLKSSVGGSAFHIRFENPGNDEITNFHLTTEEGWTQVNMGGGLWAKGRFFFVIKSGCIEPQVKNQILGHGIDQMSDMRMANLVQDTMIYVYYLMYCLNTH